MPIWTKQFDACLEVHPPVSNEQLAQIPAKRGVVLLVGQNAVPIVMITAASMRNRTKTRLAELLLRLQQETQDWTWVRFKEQRLRTGPTAPEHGCGLSKKISISIATVAASPRPPHL